MGRTEKPTTPPLVSARFRGFDVFGAHRLAKHTTRSVTMRVVVLSPDVYILSVCQSPNLVGFHVDGQRVAAVVEMLENQIITTSTTQVISTFLITFRSW